MRKICFLLALLGASPALAEDIAKGDVLSNDLSMKTDVMIRDGDVLSVSPDGHVVSMSLTPERRKALAAAFGDRGVRLDKPMLLMLRDGKLMRMESAEAANTMGLK